MIRVPESYNRALWAAPVVISGIHILNIVIRRAIVDQIITCVVFEGIIVNFGPRFSLTADDLNSILIILDCIVIDGDSSFAN